jgi:hypothetical protein
MGGGGGERTVQVCRAIRFLKAPSPPTPTIRALKPSSWALVHKTTYTPKIYTALRIMFWMHAYPLLGQVGGHWALEISIFWVLNGTPLSARCINSNYPSSCYTIGFLRQQQALDKKYMCTIHVGR